MNRFCAAFRRRFVCKMESMKSFRNKLFSYVESQYGSEPEYLWLRFPTYAVFRHADNKKWFAIVMTVTGTKLGLDSEAPIEILNVKLSDPLMIDFLSQRDGFFRGYHMNQNNWISVCLNGTVPWEEICGLLEESYRATAPKRGKNARHRAKNDVSSADELT